MNYYHLKSIISSEKTKFSPKVENDSFRVFSDRPFPYVEPNFEKIIYDNEKPPIILVSAVGASGKTTLARQLSRDTGLPVFDLASHKPVGDNTLTGILTNTFDLADISDILQGLKSGTFCVIIDGIDEGRSKTTEKGFEAFLDDIINLCSSSKGVSFVLLGRTKILDDCWDYLTRPDIQTGLISISPFSLEDAKKYIDVFCNTKESHFSEQYQQVRDRIVTKLGSAFTSGSNTDDADFLAFMGYPPVLEAVVTLLKKEQNYYKLLQELNRNLDKNVEVSLLLRIANYILERERTEKVIPNILNPLMSDAREDLRRMAIDKAFSAQEQSARLIAHCLGEPLSIEAIPDVVLNEKYEEQLSTFFLEHPFITGTRFSNAVFEALAVATLMNSGNPDFKKLLERYLDGRKYTYHLVYIFDALSKDKSIDKSHIKHLLSAAMEYCSVHSQVALHVSGPDWEEDAGGGESMPIEVEIEVILGDRDEHKHSKTFDFSSSVTSIDVLNLGHKLAGAYISLPCSVRFGASSEVELIAPIEVSAKKLEFSAPSLVLRTAGGRKERKDILFNCSVVESKLKTVFRNGCSFLMTSADKLGLSYPLIDYVKYKEPLPTDPLIKEKYFRLKRILMEFRSHSKGSLAKYRDKIQHQRVLKNETGEMVLSKLLSDGVLVRDDKFYHLDQERLNERLGVSWHDLRRGRIPELLMSYLQSIPGF